MEIKSNNEMRKEEQITSQSSNFLAQTSANIQNILGEILHDQQKALHDQQMA